MSTEIRKMQAELDTLKRQVGPPIGDRKEFTAVQVRADQAYREAIGDSAPGPLAGECVGPYTARLIQGLQRFSPRWKDTNLGAISNREVLEKIADQVFADALQEARHPSKCVPGKLAYVTTLDAANRPITRATPDSDPNACWDQFNPLIQYVKDILTPGSKR